MIPNLAIHMNREVNDGYKYNIQKDMLPLYRMSNSGKAFKEMIAEEAGVSVDQIKGMDPVFSHTILLFVICILAYLWFNATPSKLMMGDAGSRAMGFFISIAALKTGSPFIYIPVAIVLILDGGLGLLKVSLLRFLKIRILVNTRTPLHDHVRKVMGWSNTQAVFRFAIIQIMISAAVIYLIM